MSKVLDAIFLVLQTFVVVFLLFHDWVPLGRLNNLQAIRREDSLVRSAFVTLLPGIPTTIGLFFSMRYFARPYPSWLTILLWITYGTLLYGLLRAWWIPYLFVPDAKRAARYRTIFAGTHTFLPQRNGIAPDTLHVVFHVAVIATLAALSLR
jgi:hypothetical protein